MSSIWRGGEKENGIKANSQDSDFGQLCNRGALREKKRTCLEIKEFVSNYCTVVGIYKWNKSSKL